MSTTIPAFDIHAMRAATDRDGVDALERYLAEDVVWTETDARTPPSAPGVVRGRDAVLARLREAHDAGLVSRVGDGFAAGDRAAVAIVCTYPTGGKVLRHPLL